MDLTNYREVAFDPNKNPELIRIGDYAEAAYLPMGTDPTPGEHEFSGPTWRPKSFTNALCVGPMTIVYDDRALANRVRITRLLRRQPPVPTEPGYYFADTPNDSFVLALSHTGKWYDNRLLVLPDRIAILHERGWLYRLNRAEKPTIEE